MPPSTADADPAIRGPAHSATAVRLNERHSKALRTIEWISWVQSGCRSVRRTRSSPDRSIPAAHAAIAPSLGVSRPARVVLRGPVWPARPGFGKTPGPGNRATRHDRPFRPPARRRAPPVPRSAPGARAPPAARRRPPGNRPRPPRPGRRRRRKRRPAGGTGVNLRVPNREVWEYSHRTVRPVRPSCIRDRAAAAAPPARIPAGRVPAGPAEGPGALRRSGRRDWSVRWVRTCRANTKASGGYSASYRQVHSNWVTTAHNTSNHWVTG